jgi:hypothetical protein
VKTPQLGVAERSPPAAIKDQKGAAGFFGCAGFGAG